MELEELMQESIEIQEKEFYSKKFYYSYSSLNKLLWNPQVFYQMYVLGLKEEKTDAHLVQGKLIHLLLLEPEKFAENFMLSPTTLPTGNLRLVIDRVYRHHVELSRNGDPREKLEEFDLAILDIMKDMGYHQSLKTDQQRLDKILTTEAHYYWSFLKTKGNKALVDQETYNFCQSAVEIIKTNKQVCNLIGCNAVSDFDNREVMNEVMFNVDLPGKNYGFKGIIDNIVVDHDNKTIYINDIKTTSKDLKDFSESIEYYSYWMQCVMYMIIVGNHFNHLIDQQGYQVKFHFVVIDRAYQTYAFPVTEKTMTKWLDQFGKVIETAEWHYVNRSYDLPYEFAKGLVAL
jgi:hypothetical protein